VSRVFSISGKGTPDARGSLLMINAVFAHQPKAGNRKYPSFLGKMKMRNCASAEGWKLKISLLIRNKVLIKEIPME